LPFCPLQPRIVPRTVSTKDLYNGSMDGFTVTGHKGRLTKSQFTLTVKIEGNLDKEKFKYYYLHHKPELKCILEEAIYQHLTSAKFLMSADTTKAYLNFIEYLYDR
jgi:hypothetical protein